MTWTRKRREKPGRPPELGGECIRINISIGSQMKEQLSRKTQPGDVSQLVRNLLKKWMKKHGCVRLDIRVTPLNVFSVVDNMVKDEYPNLHTFLPFQGMGILYLTKKALDRRFIKKAMTTRMGLAYKLLQEDESA